ncbi:MAG: DinB family protein [Phycisphaerales bacterium]|nr:DinB family protein [Phycisphaerales bacterium]
MSTPRPPLTQILRSQFEAALAMLNECIVKCPAEHWSDEHDASCRVAKYPVWMVVYHTLCFVDCYLSPSNETWEPTPRFHPKGRQELEDEYPSRAFSREEMLDYMTYCRAKIARVLGDGPDAETNDSLGEPSGFSWLPFTRAELHIYSTRHVAHHAGQVAAYLRRSGVELAWVKAGWKDLP